MARDIPIKPEDQIQEVKELRTLLNTRGLTRLSDFVSSEMRFSLSDRSAFSGPENIYLEKVSNEYSTNQRTIDNLIQMMELVQKMTETISQSGLPADQIELLINQVGQKLIALSQRNNQWLGSKPDADAMLKNIAVMELDLNAVIKKMKRESAAQARQPAEPSVEESPFLVATRPIVKEPRKQKAAAAAVQPAIEESPFLVASKPIVKDANASKQKAAAQPSSSGVLLKQMETNVTEKPKEAVSPSPKAVPQGVNPPTKQPITAQQKTEVVKEDKQAPPSSRPHH